MWLVRVFVLSVQSVVVGGRRLPIPLALLPDNDNGGTPRTLAPLPANQTLVLLHVSSVSILRTPSRALVASSEPGQGRGEGGSAFNFPEDPAPARPDRRTSKWK